LSLLWLAETIRKVVDCADNSKFDSLIFVESIAYDADAQSGTRNIAGTDAFWWGRITMSVFLEAAKVLYPDVDDWELYWMKAEYEDTWHCTGLEETVTELIPSFRTDAGVQFTVVNGDRVGDADDEMFRRAIDRALGGIGAKLSKGNGQLRLTQIGTDGKEHIFLKYPHDDCEQP